MVSLKSNVLNQIHCLELKTRRQEWITGYYAIKPEYQDLTGLLHILCLPPGRKSRKTDALGKIHENLKL